MNRIIVMIKEPNKDCKFVNIENGSNDLRLYRWLKEEIGYKNIRHVFIRKLSENRNLVMLVDEDRDFNDSEFNIYIELEMPNGIITDSIFGPIVFAIEEVIHTEYGVEREYHSLSIEDGSLNGIEDVLFGSNEIKKKLTLEERE